MKNIDTLLKVWRDLECQNKFGIFEYGDGTKNYLNEWDHQRR
jgi:hypothetical protein